MAGKQKGLGRGLDALIKDESNKIEESRLDDKSGVEEVEISQVSKSPWQPRSNFDADLLNNLTQSVKVHGVLQPLIVREINGNFELIAGERRLRAAEAAGLKTIPVIITTASDEKALQLALIENLQREDLNPIEEAEGYALLQKQFGLTQEKVAEQVGKARTSVANSLRILDLSDIMETCRRWFIKYWPCKSITNFRFFFRTRKISHKNYKRIYNCPIIRTTG